MLQKDNQRVNHINNKQFNESSYLLPLSFLTYYKPTVSLNNSQFHFLSSEDYNPQTHQKVNLKLSQKNNYRNMIMHLQKENPKEIQQKYQNLKQFQDHSQIKDFSYLDFIENQQQTVFINKQKAVKQSIWAKKYQPKAFYQLLTDQAHNRNVLAWLKSWDPIVFNRQAPIHTPVPSTFFKNSTTGSIINQRQNYLLNQYNHTKLLLLSGPPGCGKTTLSRVLAKHCGYEVAQINASDDRSAKNLITKIQALGKSNSITSGKPTMIVVDQVDGALEQDGNGIKQVLTYIQNGGLPSANPKKQKNDKPKIVPQDLPKNQNIHHNNKQKLTQIPRPILFICNDPYVKGLKQLRSKALVVYFKQLDKQKLVRRLRQITEIEKVYIQTEVLNKIVQISNNDIRSCLSVLEYVCKSKRQLNINPKDLVNKLKLSFTKDSTTSIIEFVGKLMNQTKLSILKQNVDLRDFQYTVMQMDNKQLLLEMFFHNLSQYKNFFTRKTKECLKIYDQLRWVDQIMSNSFKYNNQLDGYVMMLFLYYRITIVNQEIRKTQFPSVFFERINKQKQHKSIIHDLLSKWPSFLQSNTSVKVAIEQYLYLLYYSIQPLSNKDNQILQCVSKMITYGIQLNHRNAHHLFKPQFDSLLTYGGKKQQILLSNLTRNLLEESYQYAKLKAHLLSQISLMDLNAKNSKNTEELMKQLNIKKKSRKRNPNQNINGIKYKFIEGSGTQITYDLKFRFFFE